MCLEVGIISMYCLYMSKLKGNSGECPRPRGSLPHCPGSGQSCANEKILGVLLTDYPKVLRELVEGEDEGKGDDDDGLVDEVDD